MAFPTLPSELCSTQEFTSTVFRYNDACRVNFAGRQAAENNCRKVNRRNMTAASVNIGIMANCAFSANFNCFRALLRHLDVGVLVTLFRILL